MNLDGDVESLLLCRIDRDGSAPIVNFDGVVESLFCAASTVVAQIDDCEPRWGRRVLVFVPHRPWWHK